MVKAVRTAVALGLAANAAFVLGAAVSATGILPAPAFKPADLLAPPTEDWLTNGGSLYNQRYSPLDQINRGNIGQLKGVWKTSLNGSGKGPGYSGEAQALERDGVLYVVTGADDVFAVSVETGAILWQYKAGLDLLKYNICCGWLSRGVGLGDGKVFVGKLDATLTALDQKTGRKVWEVQVDDPMQGNSITAAPLYYDGLVIVGTAGGENGIRGHLDAYNAKTGKRVWRFYTVPGPGEKGHETWPQYSDAWKFGGGSIWQTPAVDPELGLIYFSTGNPGPDLNGGIRKGDNLFTASIVALDVKTGAYRWHFQEVHHDIWDYDAPNPTILFDAEYAGRKRKGIAQVGKNGYLFILDRTDGTPLTPIVETPVPQEPLSATAATQPIPQGDTVTLHEIFAVGEEYAGILPNRGRTYTPFSGEKPGAYAPGTGTNWIPSSYNPDGHLMYICSVDSVGGAFGGDPKAAVGPAGPNQSYYGGGFRGPGGVGGARRQLFAAMRLTDHSNVWRREMQGGCAGSIVTAGGLIFVGRGDGRLTAMDSATGQRIWSYRTDAGIFTTVTTFLHKGRQYLAFLAGGSLFGGGRGGTDSLWLMSLDGTMEPEPEPKPAGSGAGPGAGGPGATPGFGPPPAVPTNRVADLKSGETIYRTVCQACHGEHGEGAHEVGAPLPATLTIDSIMYTASFGRQGTRMQPFNGVYSAEQFHDVATYIKEVVLAGGRK
jgi:alcohol dehydrogenase (cytochrome c)